MSKDVLVVIGAGSIGQAIARRTGPGKQYCSPT
jgi:predicted dinucleotide-binding enzyme